MKTILLLLLLLPACFLFPSSGEESMPSLSPENYFLAGNESYEKQMYQEAVDHYLQAFKHGMRTGALHYNLGNAYFKAGSLGKAVLEYERAKLLMPRDADLMRNHRYVKSMLKQQSPTPEKPLLLKWIENPFEFLSIREAVLLMTLLFYFVIFYFITAKIFRRSTFLSTFILTLASLVLLLGTVPLLRKISEADSASIIIAEITDSRYEPRNEALVHFPLYEGMKVHTVRKKGDWLKIRRADGQLGWVKSSHLSKIK